VGTALLGPSPDGSCKAVFAVVTADGAIVQEHTLKGLDGLAPPGTVRPILGGDGKRSGRGLRASIRGDHEPLHAGAGRHAAAVRQRAVLQHCCSRQPNDLRNRAQPGNLPVDLAPVERDTDNVNWASNTTLDQGSDFYVANQGDNTIVRMTQDGSVLAIRRITVNGNPPDNVALNGIATAPDGTTIYVTFIGQSEGQGGVLALPAF
jgi:hypothetical protein